MPDPKGFLIVPVAFRSDGTLRALELTNSDELKVALATAAGSDLLTELEAKLETSDLNIEAVSKDLQVDVKTTALPTGLEVVTQIPSVGPHGWIGGAWQRNPLLLGYSGRGSQSYIAQSTGASPTEAIGAVVPAGEIWVVQSMIAWHDDTVARQFSFQLYDSTADGYREIYLSPSLAPGTSVSAPHVVVLAPGDRIKLIIWSLTNTKYVLGQAWYTRVDIDQ